MTTLPPEGQAPEPQEPAQSPDSASAPGAPGAATPPQPDATMPPPGYAPPQQPGYAPPQQPGYAPPQQPAYAPAPADPLSNLQVNYWLSVVFAWVPALIFFLIEKDKGNPQVRALHAANLNFSLIRTGLLVVSWFLTFVPILGFFLNLLLGLVHLALFIFHILGAAKVTETYRAGQADPFLFNIPMVK